MEHVHRVKQTRRDILRGDIHMNEQANKEKYKEGAPHEGDIQTKETYTRRGYTRAEDIHTEGTTQRGPHRGDNTERTTQRRGYTYGREVHMKGHTYRGTYTEMNIHTERNTHGGTYTQRNMHPEKHTCGVIYTRRSDGLSTR